MERNNVLVGNLEKVNVLILIIIVTQLCNRNVIETFFLKSTRIRK